MIGCDAGGHEDTDEKRELHCNRSRAQAQRHWEQDSSARAALGENAALFLTSVSLPRKRVKKQEKQEEQEEGEEETEEEEKREEEEEE